jgi:hypothetical protein
MSIPEHDPHASTSSRSRQMLQRVGMHVRPGSFELLLAATLFLYVLNGLAVDCRWGGAGDARPSGRYGAGVYVREPRQLTSGCSWWAASSCSNARGAHDPATGVVLRMR